MIRKRQLKPHESLGNLTPEEYRRHPRRCRSPKRLLKKCPFLLDQVISRKAAKDAKGNLSLGFMESDKSLPRRVRGVLTIDRWAGQIKGLWCHAKLAKFAKKNLSLGFI